MAVDADNAARQLTEAQEPASEVSSLRPPAYPPQ
jgi:hypothetical protein